MRNERPQIEKQPLQLFHSMTVDEVDETMLIMLDEQFGSSVICIKISGTEVFQWRSED